MDLVPLDQQFCSEACLTKSMIDIEVDEVGRLKSDPSALSDEFQDGSLKLSRKVTAIGHAAHFLKFTIDACSVCIVDSPSAEKGCPNAPLLEAIRNTIDDA